MPVLRRLCDHLPHHTCRPSEIRRHEAPQACDHRPHHLGCAANSARPNDLVHAPLLRRGLAHHRDGALALPRGVGLRRAHAHCDLHDAHAVWCRAHPDARVHLRDRHVLLRARRGVDRAVQVARARYHRVVDHDAYLRTQSRHLLHSDQPQRPRPVALLGVHPAWCRGVHARVHGVDVSGLPLRSDRHLQRGVPAHDGPQLACSRWRDLLRWRRGDYRQGEEALRKARGARAHQDTQAAAAEQGLHGGGPLRLRLQEASRR
mmetsp:Transcript_20426/g.52772  ORF Transcript_20426/g.52772 Transcript_20426/m.52772 type:complete len:261 (+) Transcript_20426:422-1204(+)